MKEKALKSLKVAYPQKTKAALCKEQKGKQFNIGGYEKSML